MVQDEIGVIPTGGIPAHRIPGTKKYGKEWRDLRYNAELRAAEPAVCGLKREAEGTLWKVLKCRTGWLMVWG